MTQAWNLSQLANKVNTSGQLDAATGLSGIAPVANGGTGASSLTANNVILGNGTGAVQVVAPSTSGNVLQSNGTTWVSATFSPYPGFSTVIFASSTTWTVPTGITQARIWVVGGGAGGVGGVGGAKSGGDGGSAVAYCTGLSGTLTITIGTGGTGATNASSTSGNTSSVTGTGVSISCTGGVFATTVANGASGTGTVTTGTALKTQATANTNGGAIYGINSIISAGSTSGATTASPVTWSPITATSAGRGNSNVLGGCGGAVLIEY